MAWSKVKILRISSMVFACALSVASAISWAQENGHFIMPDITILRQLYSGSPELWPRPVLANGAKFNEFAPVPKVVHPIDNESNEARLNLGREMFNNPILSQSGQIACSSCHNPELAFGDGVKNAFGHNRQTGTRNSPHLLSVAWQDSYFWDGRAQSLEQQALGPIENPIEMAGKRKDIERKLNKDKSIKSMFKQAYGIDKIKLEDVAKSLAVFQRSIKPKYTKYDEFLKTGDNKILSDEELKGLHLFRTKAKCASCHSGSLLTDNGFHNLGLTYYGRELEDLGRYKVSGNEDDVGAFKTPSLRNISKTGPYMHNGVFPSLAGIINIYNVGGFHPKPNPEQINDPLFPKTSDKLSPLNLTPDEKVQLLAFLNTL